MNPTLPLAGVAVGVVLIVGVLAATGEINFPKTQSHIMRENGQELFESNFEFDKLVEAIVAEEDGKPVALRELPRITTDSQEDNIITKIPTGKALRGVMIEDDITGQIWLTTKWDGKLGFIKASELEVLTDSQGYDIYSIQTGQKAPLP